jgi:hypothetical protein
MSAWSLHGLSRYLKGRPIGAPNTFFSFSEGTRKNCICSVSKGEKTIIHEVSSKIEKKLYFFEEKNKDYMQTEPFAITPSGLRSCHYASPFLRSISFFLRFDREDIVLFA